MGTKTLTPEEQLLKTTREKLSKYGTPQLLSKLRSGAFFKMSKDVAIAILQKRGEDVSEFLNTGEDVKAESPLMEKAKERAKAEEAKVEKTKKSEKPVKLVKEKVEKVKKVSGEKKERKARTSLNTDQVAEILRRAEAGESTFKIRVAMELSWSTVNNILLANKSEA